MITLKRWAHSLVFFGLFCIAAVAGAEEVAQKPNPDPYESMNRAIFRFNDVLDRYIARPVAKGYVAITPRLVRQGISNFFANLSEPITILNSTLQGKFRQAGGDTARFVVNSTVGLVGLVDVAVRLDLPRHEEDFGQTLGRWGTKPGPYLMLPFLGPSSVRDGAGLMVDTFTNPRRYVLDPDLDLALWVFDRINVRAGLLNVEDIIQGDRYLFIRDLYLQRREFMLKDGQVDDPFLDDTEATGSEATNTDSMPPEIKAAAPDLGLNPSTIPPMVEAEALPVTEPLTTSAVETVTINPTIAPMEALP